MQDEPRPMDASQRIFVIGAAAGGTAAVQAILKALPAEFPASVLISLHPRHETLRGNELQWQEASAIPIHMACDGMPIEPGHVYLSLPDQHLEVTVDRRLSLSPPIPGLRPVAWVDRLFLSAVSVYGGRTVGVILTGADADGAQGMRAIHDAGGLGIVQEPSDAVDPSMPLSSLRIDHPAYCVPLREIGALLNNLTLP
jgi:two-component system chemotaxis response regulator CheB